MQVGAVLVFCGLAAGCYAFQLPMVQQRGTYIALCVVYTVVVAAVLALDIVCRYGTTQPAGHLAACMAAIH
jgi:hypothetical protein